jgi:uncharacterized protein
VSGNLSSRLKRIREAAKAVGLIRQPGSAGPDLPRAPLCSTASGGRAFIAASWMEAAPYVLHRSLTVPTVPTPASLDTALAVLCPSAQAAFSDGHPLAAERILLFDLETTGLSGGAGTVAFLSAFGRFHAASGDEARLSIDQYLMLDYPGEASFLELVMKEFAPTGGEPVLGSYNGRAFDMQILRTRCVMNGIVPPDPAHLDLVHATRRLWRRRLPSCSLADVERGVLGLDRGADLGGAEAPDAWFDFLKTGEATRLLAICDHNRRDLEGLAALLVRMEEVARSPVVAAATGQVDAEGLALRWFGAAKTARLAGAPSPTLAMTSRRLLELAATESARAAMALAGELAREGEAERAAEIRRKVAEAPGQEASAALRAMACTALATDAARRLRDPLSALAWIERALALDGLSAGLRARLEGRRERLAISRDAGGLSPSS